MKKKSITLYFSSLSIIMFSLTACLGERSLKNENAVQDSTEADNAIWERPNEALCFLRLDGADNVDSSYVYLRFNGDSVSGIHHWVPNLKDARRGVLTGTRRGDTIDVTWDYMQEGTKDTLNIVFLLEDGYLRQQPYAIQSDGRQIRDQNAEFNIQFNPVNCPEYK